MWAFLIAWRPSCLSVHSYLCLSLNFSHFQLLLQNHFQPNLAHSILAKGFSSLFKWRATSFSNVSCPLPLKSSEILTVIKSWNGIRIKCYIWKMVPLFLWFRVFVEFDCKILTFLAEKICFWLHTYIDFFKAQL